ncbi:MAG: hypothetical protein ACRD33_02810, partial [Candidatus Acidiferrales bacterium]
MPARANKKNGSDVLRAARANDHDFVAADLSRQFSPSSCHSEEPCDEKSAFARQNVNCALSCNTRAELLVP